MSGHGPKISAEAKRLLDDVFRATGEEVADAILALHRYIEKLESRRAASPDANREENAKR